MTKNERQTTVDENQNFINLSSTKPKTEKSENFENAEIVILSLTNTVAFPNSELPSAGRGALKPSESASDIEFKLLESSLSPPGEVSSPKERANRTSNSRSLSFI